MQKTDASNLVYAQLKTAFSKLAKISSKSADKAYSLFRTVELNIGGSGVTSISDLGVVIVSAICVRNGVSTEAANAAAAKIGPRKTRLCKIFAEAGYLGTPDVLCSTDGYRHDYGLGDGVEIEEAAKLLRPAIRTKPVGHIGQYILLKLSSGNGNAAGDFYIYLSTMNYQLMQRGAISESQTPEPFIVPVTTSSPTVVPNTKIYFPLLFISQKKINKLSNKFSFTNHPGKQQLVYTITKEFQIQHPRALTSNRNSNRLSFDKKCVFLTREIVAKNLQPIAKTVPISLL